MKKEKLASLILNFLFVIFAFLAVGNNNIYAAVPVCTSWDSITVHNCTAAEWAMSPKGAHCRVSQTPVQVQLNSQGATAANTTMRFAVTTTGTTCSDASLVYGATVRAYAATASVNIPTTVGFHKVCVKFTNASGSSKCGANIQVVSNATATPVPTDTPFLFPTDTPTPNETIYPNPTDDPTNPTLAPEDEGFESDSTPGEDAEADIPYDRTPTPTINPLCLCGSNNICAGNNVCRFNKFPASSNFNYSTPMKCQPLVVAKYRSFPTALQSDKWCRRPMRTKGDANGNGVADLVDYFYTMTVINTGGKIPATVNPDFDGNGLVNGVDRQIVIKSINNN